MQRRVAVAAVAALVVTAVGVRLWSADGDLRDADVVLRAGNGVTVTLPGGVVRSAVDGESLPRGAVVATGPGATATLDVRDRLIVLAPDTTVGVPDGSAADLRRGSILVDRRRGPDVSVTAGAVVLDEVDEGAVRVDRGFSVRVSVFSGAVRARTSDRELEIPRLYQAAVAGRALPDRPTPLRLTGDDWEQRVIPAVTSADAELSQLARGIDQDRRLTDSTQVQLLPAAYRGALFELPTGAGRSEALLPVAIGLAVDDGSVGDARRLRSAGGSWGVVAALVGARTADVSARLSELLAGPGEQQRGEPVVGGPTGSDDNGPQPTTSSGPRPTPTSGRPSPTRSPSASPSPSPSSSDALSPIRDLLPSASPSSTASPSSLPLLGSPRPLVRSDDQGGLSGILKALLG